MNQAFYDAVAAAEDRARELRDAPPVPCVPPGQFEVLPLRRILGNAVMALLSLHPAMLLDGEVF